MIREKVVKRLIKYVKGDYGGIRGEVLKILSGSRKYTVGVMYRKLGARGGIRLR